jgi:YtkA-like protein
MRPLVVLATVVAALALPGTSVAGGWATVGFQPLPDGMAAGATWKPRIFVKQHGVTPLAGLEPLVVIEEVGTGSKQEFAATETSETGVYEADVVFPEEGDWRVTIHSGFGDSFVTYGPASIRPVGGDSQPLPFAVLALVLLGALAVVGARRWRGLSPASG